MRSGSKEISIDIAGYSMIVASPSRRWSRDGRCGPELEPGEMRVTAVSHQKFLVAALLRDPAGLEDDDPIGQANRGQAMRDDERGAPPRGLLERLQHRPLGGGVQARRGL